MIDNDWPYPKGFMKSGYLEPSKIMFDFWHFFGSRCSPGLWRLREHTWTINGKFQKVDAVWGFGFETTGHMWTINWGTISMWPWSRERGLERSGGSRDCNGFLATRTRRRLAARSTVQQPSLESWGSQIDVFLSEYNIFDIWMINVSSPLP